VAVVFGACVIGCFIASWARWDAFAGWVFFMATGLAAYYARPGVLLPVVVSPPVLFLLACMCAKVATAPGLLPAMSGAVVTLAGVAGWMITGMVLAVGIALGRGVAGEVRDLMADFRSRYLAGGAISGGCGVRGAAGTTSVP
jgi:hypothetical protein